MSRRFFVVFLAMLCWQNMSGAAEYQCANAAKQARDEYDRNVSILGSKKLVAIHNEKRSYKSKVNSLFYRHKTNRTPQAVYQKQVDDETIKHHSNLRVIDREYKDNLEKLNQWLSDRLRQIQAGECN